MTNFLRLLERGILPWTTTTEQSVKDHIDNLFFCGYVEEENSCCERIGACSACQKRWLDAKATDVDTSDTERLWQGLFAGNFVG